MTRSVTKEKAVPGDASRSKPWPRSGAITAVLAGTIAVAISILLGGGYAVGLLAAAAIAVGYGLGRKDGTSIDQNATRLLMFRVADELAQYRAFTKLLRDQGQRITATTSEAATAIVVGLREVDANVERVQAILGRDSALDASELRAMLAAIGAPLIKMLGQIQFQDITQQQMAFLSRLSCIVDQHMIDLAGQLGDRRSMDRVGNFKEMFNKALDDCVMTSQREDHQAAVGLDLHEAGGPKIELF